MKPSSVELVELALFLFDWIAVSSAQISIDLKRHSSQTALQRRRNHDSGPLPVSHPVSGGFFLEATVATQTLSLQVRTGAGLISWVPSSNASVCRAHECTMGYFNQNLSDTFHLTAEEWAWYPMAEPDVVAAEGFIFTDDLGLGNATIPTFHMGIAYDLEGESGVLNLGSGGVEDESQQDSLVVQLVAGGHIPTEAYSVWLNYADTLNASLLFGAIDTNKYRGDLVSVDMVYLNSSDHGPRILLSSFQATSQTGSDVLLDFDSPPISVTIALGPAMSYLPQNLAEAAWEIAGAEYHGACNCPVVPCSLAEAYGYFTYYFGGRNGPNIVPRMRQMVISSKVWDLQINNTQGAPLCAFTIFNETNPTNYLVGQDLLGATYFVVDQSNNQVAMARPVYDSPSEESNVVAFVGHGALIPSATLASNQPTNLPATLATTTTFPPKVSTSYAAASGFANVVITSHPAPSSTSTANRGGSNAASYVGVAVSGAFTLVVIAIMVMTMRFQRLNRKLARERIAAGILDLPEMPAKGPEEGMALEVLPETKKPGDDGDPAAGPSGLTVFIPNPVELKMIERSEPKVLGLNTDWRKLPVENRLI